MKFFTLFVFLLCSVSFAEDNSYVGAERCRSCHLKAYEIWFNSAHAQAQNILPTDKKRELRCLFCHATDAQSNLSFYKFQNVQCESCHGAGGRHIALAGKELEKGKPVGGLEPATEARCRVCHADVRSTRLRPFQYDTALQRIRHW